MENYQIIQCLTSSFVGLPVWCKGCAAEKYTLAVHLGGHVPKGASKETGRHSAGATSTAQNGFLGGSWRACGKTCLTDQKK